MAGRLMSKGAASSVTERSPEARRARMARRVGSASAAKVALRRSFVISKLTIWLIYQLVKYKRVRLSSPRAHPLGTPRRPRPEPRLDRRLHRVVSARIAA